MKRTALLLVNKIRQDLRRPVGSRGVDAGDAYNFVFTGKSGTGKSVVAALFAKLLVEVGLHPQEANYREIGAVQLRDMKDADIEKLLKDCTPGTLCVTEVRA